MLLVSGERCDVYYYVVTRVVVIKRFWVTHVASCLYFSSDYSSLYSQIGRPACFL